MARRLLHVGLWLGGVGLCVWLVRRTGTAVVLQSFERVGWRFGYVLATYALTTAVTGLPWRWLLPPAHRPSLRATLASRFAASGLNAVLPLAGAGELSRLLWLPSSARPAGAVALLVDRLAFGLSCVAALIVGAIATRLQPNLPARFGLAAAAGAAVLLGLIALAAVLVVRGRFARYPRLRSVAAEIAAGVAALRADPRGFVAALGVHLVGRVLAVVEIAVALAALGWPVGASEAALFASVPLGLALVGPFVPGQVGLQEGAQAMVAEALGLGAPVGLTLVLLQRARVLAFLPVTAFLLAVRRRSTP